MRKILALLLSMSASMAFAETVSFSGWNHQTFPLKSASQYSASGSTLNISSNGGVSIFYTSASNAQTASWTWSVSQSVPATSLKSKGGDDRNIALYFIFAPADQAAALKNQKASKLLSNSAVKALVYTYGGSEARGARFMNPYMSGRGMNVILRSAGTGTHSESVNLKSDAQGAFGAGLELIGVAVSSDSDDTGAQISAQIKGLQIN